MKKLNINGYCSGKTTAMSSLMRRMAGYRKENIFIMVNDLSDNAIYQQPYLNKMDIQKLFGRLKSEYINTMTNICLTPHGYDTVLKEVQSMTLDELNVFLRNRDIDSIYQDL